MGKIVKRAIRAPQVLNDPAEYGKSFSRGLKVAHAGAVTLYLSGTASVGPKGETLFPGDFPAQARRTFHNLTALLASEGAGWHDVVHTRCYLKSMRHYPQFNEVRNSFYRKLGLSPFPASVCVQAGLCRPHLLVEIEAVAVLPERKKGNIKP